MIWMGALTFQSGNEEIDLVAFGVRPALDDRRPELDVGLVHLRGLAHVDLVRVEYHFVITNDLIAQLHELH